MDRKTRRYSIGMQLLVWGLMIFSLPFVSFIGDFNVRGLLKSVLESLKFFAPILALYYINYLVLVPGLLFKGKRWLHLLSNLLLILSFCIWILVRTSKYLEGTLDSLPESIPDISPLSIGFMAAFVWFIFLSLTAAVSVGTRSLERNRELSEKMAQQKQESTEAELSWLKSQLNPHFLFNTLNNISSLTMIDPEKAQDSIAQLSDLLRYALYDSEDERVPLSGETAFMENYIHLMKLRCNEMTRVDYVFEDFTNEVKVAPLLFISLIENAFKHGVNARFQSFVDIEMRSEGSDLVFRCSNSTFEKSGSDHIGSGIGLENMKRRLDLLYGNNYTYEVEDKEGTYTATVVLKGICKHSDNAHKD